MRKQYHFWPGADGLDGWDVDRLIELSRELAVTDVELSSIGEIDSVYWFDESRSRQCAGLSSTCAFLQRQI